MAGRDILIRFLGQTTGVKTSATEVESAMGKVETSSGKAGSALSTLIGKIPGIGDAFGGVKKNLGEATDEAEKAGGGMLGVGVGAATAGIAVGAFALKAVGDYQKLGIEVGNFATATGLSANQSSRWIEVAKDHGIATDTLETAIGKVNKTLGKSPQMFRDAGVAIAYTKDHTVDANGTFLNVIDTLGKIKNPAEQARVGAELLGKGWQGMSALISEGAPKLVSDLQSVGKAQIFNDSDVDMSKKLREGFNEIKDSAEGLMLTIGKALAPVIASLAPVIADTVKAVEPLVTAIGTNLANAIVALTPIVGGSIKVLDALVKSAEDWSHRVKSAVDWAFGNDHQLKAPKSDIDAVTGAFDWQAIAANDLKLAYTGLSDELKQHQEVEHGVIGAINNYNSETTSAAQITNARTESAGKLSEMLAGQLTLQEANAVAAAAATEETKLQTASTDALNSILQRQIDDLGTERDSLDEARKAQQDYIDAQRAATDATFALHKATVDYDDAEKSLKDSIKAAKGDHDKITVAIDDHTQKAVALADATEKVYEKQITANGGTITAIQKQDLLNQSMLTSATKTTPAARDAIADYIITTNGIPPEKATDIRAAIHAGDIDTANALITAASATRTASIKVDVDDASIAALNAKIKAGVVHNINLTPVTGAHAIGTGDSDGSFIAGEHGPELVVGHPHATVFTAAQTEMIGKGEGGVTINIYGDITDNVQAKLDNFAQQIAARIQAGKRST